MKSNRIIQRCIDLDRKSRNELILVRTINRRLRFRRLHKLLNRMSVDIDADFERTPGFIKLEREQPLVKRESLNLSLYEIAVLDDAELI